MTLAIRNSRAPVAPDPSLVAARADESEADPAEAVAADPSVIDAERHPLYCDGVDHESNLGRPGDAAQGDPQSSVRPGTAEYPGPWAGGLTSAMREAFGRTPDEHRAWIAEQNEKRESVRQSRLSRWQEQR